MDGKRRGRPPKMAAQAEAVETKALAVVEGEARVITSREDRREVAREQRKRDRMRRKAERAAMAIWLLGKTADQVVKQSETEDPFGEKRPSKVARQAVEKAQAAGLQILDELSGKLREELW